MTTYVVVLGAARGFAPSKAIVLKNATRAFFNKLIGRGGRLNMNWSWDDTIVAVAAPAGAGARAILRLSGPQTLACLAAHFTADKLDANWRDAAPQPPAPSLWRGRWRTAATKLALPGDLYVWPGNRSFTRQPSAEFHTLPSPPLVDALLLDLQSQGVRLARPGEFTCRAFLSGRLDLTQAEAVLAVIDAQDQRQLRTALDQLAGGLARPLTGLRNRLVDLLAQIEARLDFSEDEVPPLDPGLVASELRACTDAIEELLVRCSARVLPTTRPHVVLVGPPNAGKSSLFNALLGRSAALVSPQAGTTRDRLSAELDCGDFVVELHDTAGWTTKQLSSFEISAAADATTPADDAIAQAMRRQTRQAIQQADLLLICSDAAAASPLPEQFLPPSSAQRIFVQTKCDQAEHVGARPHVAAASSHPTSARTGAGLPELIQAIARALRQSGGEVYGPTAVRCLGGLQAAQAACRRGLAQAECGGAEELVAHELRETLAALADVAGATRTDDVLDRIFSRFCIGK